MVKEICGEFVYLQRGIFERDERKRVGILGAFGGGKDGGFE